MTRKSQFYNYRRKRPILTLWHLYEGQRPRLLAAVFFFILKQSPVWILPIMIGRVINLITDPATRTMAAITPTLIVLVIFQLQNIPTNILYTNFFSRALRNMENRLRRMLVQQIQQLSIAFHDDFQSGRMHAKVLRDVESLENLSRQLMQVVLSTIMTVGSALIVTIARSPLVALFFIGVVPVAVTLTRLFKNRITKRNREYRQQVEFLSARMSEMLEMVPVTRAHGVEHEELRQMSGVLDEVRDRGIRLDILSQAFVASSWVSFQIFSTMCLTVTSYLALSGRIPIGDLVMYQSFFTLILMSVSGLLNIFPQLAKGFEAINSIGEVLESPDIEQNEGKEEVTSVSGNLTFDNITFSYPGTTRPAVADFSLDISSGEIIAFVGPSGSGKSTLMNLVIGFRRPDTGRILLDGKDISGLDLRTFRRHIAVVPQNTILFSGSIRDNVAYGMPGSVSDLDIVQALEQANAIEFVNRLPEGLETVIGEHGARLSGGQRQRIAIARALIRDPRIIIMDEATSSLDVIAEAQVQKAIEELVRGRTTFIVAHRLSTIRMAQRIVVLKEGRCVEIGTETELLDKLGEFYELKSLQA